MDILKFELKPKQMDAINHILKGEDVICNLPVGYGKSLIFHILPELFSQRKTPRKVVVICPLTSLMEDQLERLSNFKIPAIYFRQDGAMIKNLDQLDGHCMEFSGDTLHECLRLIEDVKNCVETLI